MSATHSYQWTDERKAEGCGVNIAWRIFAWCLGMCLFASMLFGANSSTPLTQVAEIIFGDNSFMSATHSYQWTDERKAEVAAKTEVAAQVLASLAAKQQGSTLEPKEKEVYDAALDYMLTVLR